MLNVWTNASASQMVNRLFQICCQFDFLLQQRNGIERIIIADFMKIGMICRFFGDMSGTESDILTCMTTLGIV